MRRGTLKGWGLVLSAATGFVVARDSVEAQPVPIQPPPLIVEVFSTPDPPPPPACQGTGSIPLDFWTRPLTGGSSSFAPQATGGQVPPQLSTDMTYYFWEVRFRGPWFRSFMNNTSPYNPLGDSHCDINASLLQCFITAQIWLPGPNSDCPLTGPGGQVEDPEIDPLAVISSGTFEDVIYAGGYTNSDGPTDDEALNCGRYLARQGICFVRWIQGDHVLPNRARDLPTDSALQPLWGRFGYMGGESTFAKDARKHMMAFAGDGPPSDNELTLNDLRLDYRFALAQGAILTATFLQRVAENAPNAFGNDPAKRQSWANRLRVIYSGGSKDGLGSMTAAGVDSRAVGVRVGSAPAWNVGEVDSGGNYTDLAFLPRYKTDWLEIESATYDSARQLHENAQFADWAFRKRDITRSNANAYFPSRALDVYERLKIIDQIGTHDNLSPLGSTESFFRKIDGLQESASSDWTVSATETAWDVRIHRDINRDHARSVFLDDVEISALVTHTESGGQPAVYAGGLFALPGGVAEHRVAKWDGTQWTPIGGAFNRRVTSLASYPDLTGGASRLIVGGEFTTADGGQTSLPPPVPAPLPFLGAWNGTRWVALGNGQTPPDAPVRVLRVLSVGGVSRLGAGGDFVSVGALTGSLAANHVAFFTPAMGWERCGEGTNGPVFALERFDDPNDVVFPGEQVIAGGSFTRAGGPQPGGMDASNVARWHDGIWTSLDGVSASGSDGPVFALQSVVLAQAINVRLYIGGRFATIGPPGAKIVVNNVASWRIPNNGYLPLPGPAIPGTDGPVLALIPSANQDKLFIGGDFNSAAGIASTSRVASWDGVSWAPLSQGVDGRVAAFTLGPHGATSKIYAAGRFQRVGDGTTARNPVTAKLIARWGAGIWSPLGTPEAQLAPPLMIEELMVRRLGERLFSCNGQETDVQPRIDRGRFAGPEDPVIIEPIPPWTIQVHVPAADLPAAAQANPAAWERYTVFLAMSDDRDFRRSDNRGFESGPVHLFLNAVPSNPNMVRQESLDRYSPLLGEETPLGPNRIWEGNGNADRASVYFDTQPNEDFFHEIEIPPSGVSVNGDFRTLTFARPPAFAEFVDPLPLPIAVPIVAAIVRLRVGLPDDGFPDDVAFTDVAFRNDDLYSTYSTIPPSPPPAPVVLSVSPRVGWGAGDTRADPLGSYLGDVVLIHGTGFFLTDSSNPAPTVTFETSLASAVSVINCRTIQCRVPAVAGIPPFAVAVTVTWPNHGSSSLPNAFTFQ